MRTCVLQGPRSNRKGTLGNKVAEYFTSGKGATQLSLRHDDLGGFEEGLDNLSKLHNQSISARVASLTAAKENGQAQGTASSGGVPPVESRAPSGTSTAGAKALGWGGLSKAAKEQKKKVQPWKRSERFVDGKKATRPPLSQGARIVKQLEAMDVRAVVWCPVLGGGRTFLPHCTGLCLPQKRVDAEVAEAVSGPTKPPGPRRSYRRAPTAISTAVRRRIEGDGRAMSVGTTSTDGASPRSFMRSPRSPKPASIVMKRATKRTQSFRSDGTRA